MRGHMASGLPIGTHAESLVTEAHDHRVFSREVAQPSEASGLDALLARKGTS